MKKLNALGIGPKIALIAIPYFVGTYLLSIFYSEIFCVYRAHSRPFLITGIILLSIGCVFYIVTAVLLLQGIRQTCLVTKGTYYLCQNPLYASIILMVFPGVAFLMQSWLVLSSSLVGYLVFRIYIGSEYREMETFFGEAYNSYRQSTPAFFPFPYKKWFGRN